MEPATVDNMRMCQSVIMEDPAMQSFVKQVCPVIMFRGADHSAGERWRKMVRQAGRRHGVRVRTGRSSSEPLLCWAYNARLDEELARAVERDHAHMDKLDELLTP